LLHGLDRCETSSGVGISLRFKSWPKRKALLNIPLALLMYCQFCFTKYDYMFMDCSCWWSLYQMTSACPINKGWRVRRWVWFHTRVRVVLTQKLIDYSLFGFLKLFLWKKGKPKWTCYSLAHFLPQCLMDKTLTLFPPLTRVSNFLSK
jgi:hypothetical protein